MLARGLQRCTPMAPPKVLWWVAVAAVLVVLAAIVAWEMVPTAR
jgi:hypothetical protein